MAREEYEEEEEGLGVSEHKGATEEKSREEQTAEERQESRKSEEEGSRRSIINSEWSDILQKQLWRHRLNLTQVYWSGFKKKKKNQYKIKRHL